MRRDLVNAWLWPWVSFGSTTDGLEALTVVIRWRQRGDMYTTSLCQPEFVLNGVLDGPDIASEHLAMWLAERKKTYAWKRGESKGGKLSPSTHLIAWRRSPSSSPCEHSAITSIHAAHTHGQKCVEAGKGSLPIDIGDPSCSSPARIGAAISRPRRQARQPTPCDPPSTEIPPRPEQAQAKSRDSS